MDGPSTNSAGAAASNASRRSGRPRPSVATVDTTRTFAARRRSSTAASGTPTSALLNAAITGTFRAANAGPATGPIDGGATAPLYFDLALGAGAASELTVPAGHRVLAYVFEGAAAVAGVRIGKGTMAVLGDGTTVRVIAEAGGARLLVLGGRPLGEPVVHYGPFVMNTREELETAYQDYQAGRMGRL